MNIGKKFGRYVLYPADKLYMQEIAELISFWEKIIEQTPPAAHSK